MKRLVVLAALSASPALAQESERWGTFGNWGVYIDDGLNRGCYAVVGYNDGSFFRAGMDQINSLAYLYFWRPEWQSLQPGQEFFIELYFGELEDYWEGNAEAHEFADGSRYLGFATTDFVLLEDVLNEDSVRIVYDGKDIATFDLRDSDQAVLAVLQCQDEVDGRAGNETDPVQQ